MRRKAFWHGKKKKESGEGDSGAYPTLKGEWKRIKGEPWICSLLLESCRDSDGCHRDSALL